MDSETIDQFKRTKVEHIKLNEAKILELLSHGNTTKEIGEVMLMSARTVEGYIYRMLIETGCSNTVHLVASKFRDGSLK